MGLTPATPAPYDTLETVAQLTRTVIADYIAGINPSPQGTANVNGTALTWVSGPQFSIYFNGAQIQVNGQPNTVAAVTGPTSLILVNTQANANGIPWSATIPTGDIFADAQAYVVPTINLAWRKLQKKLADKGHTRLTRKAVVSALPVVANLDPGSAEYIDWTGFWDGVAKTSLPALPQDFLSPVRLWERPNAPAVNYNRFKPMRLAPDTLYSKPKGSWNQYWDWHDDKLFFPGSILVMDLQMEYSGFLADLVPAVGGFASTPVPIMRCAEALAYYTAAEFVNPRGGVMGQTWEAKGDIAVDQITNAQAKLQQRTSYSRIPWGSRGRRRTARG